MKCLLLAFLSENILAQFLPLLATLRFQSISFQEDVILSLPCWSDNLTTPAYLLLP